MKKLSLNLGHVTNSSSMVFWFPREILEDEEVRAFLEAFDLTKGWVGADLSCRIGCRSFLLTKEQKQTAAASVDGCYREPVINLDGDEVVVIYGDEHSDATAHVAEVLSAACQRLGLEYTSEEYN